MRRLLLLLSMMLCGCSVAQTLRVMEWNVENMFHPSGPGAFTPDGEYRWTYGRFMRKANMIAQAMAAAGRPDIVAMCEVEDDSTMIGLTQFSVMRTLGYRWLRTHGSDERGINIGVVYDPFSFRPVTVREVRVPSVENGFRPTRNILYVAGEVLRDGVTDTLHLVVCHLPSQAGGTREADHHRRLAAQTLSMLTDSVLSMSPDAALVVTGDFNSAKPRAMEGLRHLPFDFDGTYRYQGDWSHLDHVFCSPRIEADTAHVIRHNFLLEENKTYGGAQPFRTFRGTTYHGGVSDHLPVVVNLMLRGL